MVKHTQTIRRQQLHNYHFLVFNKKNKKMFMKLRKIRNCLQGIFNCTKKTKILLHQHLRQVKMYFYCFYFIFLFFGICIHTCSMKSNFKQKVYGGREVSKSYFLIRKVSLSKFLFPK